MRVRKLAQDLQCSPEQVLAVLQKIGHTRYKDPEQQLPDAVIHLVRKHSGELRKGRTWSPPVDVGPPRNFDDRHATTEDREILTKVMAGVRPIHAARPSARPRAAAQQRGLPHPAPPAGAERRSPALDRPQAIAPPAQAPAVTPGDPDALRVELLRECAELRIQLEQERADLRAERVELRVERENTREEREQLRRDGDLLRGDAGALRRDTDQLRRRAEEAEAEVVRLQVRVVELEGAARLGGGPSVAAPGEERLLRRVLEARGLRGDDECAQLIGAFVAHHRGRELMDHLHARSADLLGALLLDRVLLVGPGEEAPTGLVPVVVSAERSEGPAGLRVPVERLVTALMVNGRRRIALIGGYGAGLRVLRDVLDARIELRTFPAPGEGSLPDVPAGMVVVLWGEAAEQRNLIEQYPDAVRVPTGGLARLCAATTAYVERGG